MTATKMLAAAAVGSFLSACATNSTQTKIYRDMAIGAALGSVFGQMKPDNRTAYTLMYGGLGAAAGAVISTAYNVPEGDQIKRENELLKSQVQKFEKQMQPQLVQRGSSLFASPIPKEVSGLVEPGEWKRYKMDQWVQDPNQPNTWYRQVEMFEIIPPVAR